MIGYGLWEQQNDIRKGKGLSGNAMNDGRFCLSCFRSRMITRRRGGDSRRRTILYVEDSPDEGNEGNASI